MRVLKNILFAKEYRVAFGKFPLTLADATAEEATQAKEQEAGTLVRSQDKTKFKKKKKDRLTPEEEREAFRISIHRVERDTSVYAVEPVYEQNNDITARWCFFFRLDGLSTPFLVLLGWGCLSGMKPRTADFVANGYEDIRP